ncbi:alanine:cation symporter family protein [Paenibacillus albiflavus]|uniref:Alanine:cation symporter family protein n=1 Tax=Paenibacillus albiflavus TaxID=2545760 RepID=A0A4R4EBK0_9BACL|nr:alanine/glycine:cation symporter family protein [Paenibacillus albiflavus]TCZ75275.1 alanine:cation symporter family protein [Paenibacillus albiflavus]
MVAWLDQIIRTGNTILWSYVLIIVLIGSGVYFTIRTRFVQFRLFGEMIRLLGKETTGNRSNKKGSVSSFQAFCIGTASRVGTGNIAGVAIAISLGGPGAVFWMWVIALIGGASAFVESTLAQIYKVRDGQVYRGGPAYYMEKALNKRWLGVIFSILITISFGFVFNSVQANTAALSFEAAFGIPTDAFAIVLAILVVIVIFGGVKNVAKLSSIIVPVMAILYILIALYMIVVHFTRIPEVISYIIGSAFGWEQAVSGGIGAAMMEGIKRGLFSNEAGMGSAPNAAATAEVTHPVKQGLIQALGVFTDTLLICSATAFIILFADIPEGMDLMGIQLTQYALTSSMGSWVSGLLAVMVFMFAYSSIIGNYYYGETNIEFLNGSKMLLFCYRIIVVAMVIFGSLAQVQVVWDLADLFMGLMALLNLGVILVLGRIAFAALQDYMKQRKAGKDPQFVASHIDGLTGAECWEDH